MPAPATTFWRLVADAAAARPDAPVASDDHGRSLDRAGLRDRAEDVAAALVARGVGPGTVVSWQLPTTLEALVLLVALTRVGAVQNPLIPLLREREVGFITGQVGTDLLVVPSTWRGFDHGRMARDLAPTVGCDVLEVGLDDLAGGGPGLRLPAGDGRATAGPAVLPPPPDADGDRWRYYSSGTTAAPKGARHTDAGILASSNALVDLMALGDGDVYPIAWPVTHIGGVSVLVASLRRGVHLVLFETFDAGTPVRMAAHRPTVCGAAVPFFRAFVAADRAHGGGLFPALRYGCFGGAPVPAEVHDEVRAALGVPLVGAWGLTEFPNATSATPDDDAGTLTWTVGRPSAGTRLRVVDASGATCGPGEEGELRLAGPQCLAGYVDPALDAEAFDAEGWFRTGDLGTVDAAGNVRITGRLKDVVIRNAENISVVAVEEALFRHPAVADAAVLGVPDARTGERVAAVVVLREGHRLDLDGLRRHCRGLGLAAHTWPEQLAVVDALPRNAMGKVVRQDLRPALMRGDPAPLR